MPTLPSLRLKSGRDRALRSRHPWVLSGSVDRVSGEPEPGDTIQVLSAEGEQLGIGDYDPGAQIRVRLHAFGKEPPDPEERWLEARLEAAITWRREYPGLRDAEAIRLVHAEGDGLPGLIVDRYAEWIVLKPGTPAMGRRVRRAAEWLSDQLGSRGAWLRGEGPRGGEAIDSRTLAGEVPDEPVEIDERGRRYLVDLKRGQKTGFYLDQREARDLCGRLSAGRRVLDLFSYTGGFALAALEGGSREAVAVESSDPAVSLLRRNAPRAEVVMGDVAQFLRNDSGRFELIVCDPPPLARRRRDVPSACRAYKDLNLWALRRATPGAFLLTFTCSHHIDAALFRKVVFSAATDARADVVVVETLGAAPDHPVSLHHPQGEYLKGLLLRVVEPGR
jgi:23S rRNA (cytosine1962-C5)-methyltransferase